MENKFNKLFFYYLILLFFFSIIYLYSKHDVANDSTISEWLINYSGGFTKRGLIGQICILIANFLNTNLRDVILIFQILLIGLYFILLFKFINNIKINKVFILSIFTPIFILYPVAEIEVLARKEVFIFALFLLHTLISSLNNNFIRLSKLVILPLSVLIWEPVVFFLPLWIFIDFVNFKTKNYEKNFFSEIFFYFPAILIAFIFIINPLTPEEHSQMAQVLSKEFNEVCYMSCALLNDKSTIYQQFEANFGKYSLEVFIRYFLIILIGFGPLFILIYYSKLKSKKIIFLKKFNLLSLFLFLLSPVLLLFAMGYDWGRWVNISYVMTLITFFYLYKNNFIILDTKQLNLNRLNLLKPKYFIYIFIIYAFTWNPKTVITGDVASFPLYRIIYKFIKIYLL